MGPVTITGTVGTVKFPAGKRAVVEIKLDKDQADMMLNIGRLLGAHVEICGPIKEVDHPDQSEFGDEPPISGEPDEDSE